MSFAKPKSETFVSISVYYMKFSGYLLSHGCDESLEVLYLFSFSFSGIHRLSVEVDEHFRNVQ